MRLQVTANGTMQEQEWTVVVQAVNDAPIIDLTGVISPVLVTEEDTQPARLFAGLIVTDADDTTIAFIITIDDAQTGDELVSADAGVSVSPDGFNATVDTQSIAGAIAAVETLGFRTTSEVHDGGRNVTIAAVDSDGTTMMARMMVSIMPVNDPHSIILGSGTIQPVVEGQ